MAKTIVKVYQGGTGAETASAARTALGAAPSAFTQTGTGAVATTVDAKLKEVVSVKDFGATGDGSTDDTAAIQAAWDAIKDTYNTHLVFPAGKYVVNSALDFRISNILSGRPHSHVITGGGVLLDFSGTSLTSGSLVKFGATSASYVNETSRFCLRGFCIKGPHTGRPATDDTAATSLIGLDITHALGLALEDIQVRQCYTGIKSEGTWYIAANNAGANRCYVGLHMSSGSTIGDWNGCVFSEGRFGIVLQPGANDQQVYGQTFISTNIEGNEVGVVADPLSGGSGVGVDNIRFISPYFEGIEYDAVRIGRTWDKDDAAVKGTDQTDRAVFNIRIEGGVWSSSTVWGAADHDAVLLHAADSSDAPAGLVIDIPVQDATEGYARKSVITSRMDPYQGTGTTSISTSSVPVVQNANFGILRPADTYPLEVEGDSKFFTDGGGELLIDKSGASGVMLQQTNGGVTNSGSLKIRSGTQTTFTTNDVDSRMTIASTGRVTVAKASNSEITALTDASTVAVDFDDASNFSLLTTSGIGASRALGTPSNITAGQSGCIVITSDDAMRDLTYTSAWHFEGGIDPSLTVTSGGVDTLVYYCPTASVVQAVLLKDLK